MLVMSKALWGMNPLIYHLTAGLLDEWSLEAAGANELSKRSGAHSPFVQSEPSADCRGQAPHTPLLTSLGEAS